MKVQIVHAEAHVDRIDLDVAVVGEGGGDVRVRFVQTEATAQKAAGCETGDDEGFGWAHACDSAGRRGKNKAASRGATRPGGVVGA